MDLQALQYQFLYVREKFLHKQFFPFVRRLMPRWLVVQAFIKAAASGKGIADNEVVPEVPFMLVYKRWHDGDFPGRSSDEASPLSGEDA